MARTKKQPMYDFSSFNLYDYLNAKDDETIQSIKRLDDVLPKWRDEVEKCESPIEKILYVFLIIEKPDDMRIDIQHELVIMGDIKRPDFLISLKPAKYGLPRPLFIVETDGSFHNEEEFVIRDKMRDRWMLSEGFPVVRFTGKEVFNDPGTCAWEVHEMFWTYKDNLMASIFDSEDTKSNPFSQQYRDFVDYWKDRKND